MSGHSLPPPRHEASDVSPGLLRPLAAIMAAMVLVAFAVCWWAYPLARRAPDLPDPQQLFATPQLQRSPRADMAAFKAAEDKELNSYGWVDKAHGVVHVPIKQAMQKMAQDGIPDWPEAAR